ncbi:MAG TPA: FAD-dependent oxidoreductase, partial [Desulfobacteraceae bacterium]|nr:FAD-dependent oxidoreductase [Desulfobacteraceae bacterium]
MVKKEKFQAPADTIGAVMVVGGGISGMQASLDMADSGFKVYLVERDSTIGGKMAQLDKTFPTNDCSTCMISPKLIEVASNPNIEILTLSNIKEISGIPGNFRVKVKTRPRYIDLEKCTACGECTKVCPVDIPAGFDESLGKRKAVYRHFPQAIPAEYLIDKADRAPCNRACPAGINVQGYIAMIKVGKYKEAIEIIMKDMPLPGVLGRVCFNPCEDACRRAEVDAPLSIRDLKRFAAKQVDLLSLPLPDIDWKNEKVAIVGSGPSGLSAGYFLGLKGYRSTIFEALPVAGGMLAVGIPQYRLPGEVLNKEIENIKRFGVEIRTSSPIGKDHTVDDLLKEGYTSVYIAVGAHRGTGLRLPGEEDYSGILHGVGWLRDISLKKTKRLENKKVVIIGGGNTAIDAARSAIRFGAARVEILYRRTSEEMPANPHEIDEALKEGVKISYLVSPVSIKGERKILQGLVCVKNRLEKSDASGRPRPVPIDGSDFFVEADLILPSIGQGLDESCLNETGIGISERGWIVSDPETMETDKMGVFAGGDAVLGPTSVIEAIAQGKQAAQVIADFIQGKEEFGVKKRKLAETPNYRPIDHDIIEIDRAKVPSLEVPDRVLDFREVAQAFSEDVARKEASRCLDCGICCECFQCVDACKADAINHNDTEKIEEISVGSIILSPGFKTFDAHEKPEYGHGRFPNVLTSIEYERMLSAAGPFQGHIIRPSDHKEPKKIAWLQCIGSRDASIGYDYCSYVCCMYATKQAIISKEHDAGIEAAIFYIDMRAQGKGFDRYYERARTSLGVRYVRSMVSRVIENPLTNNLEINFIDEEGDLQTEEFDMVILSVGLRPHPSIDNLSKN